MARARILIAATDADLRGTTADPALWRTATLTGARVDIGQAMAFAMAHGLRLDAKAD